MPSPVPTSPDGDWDTLSRFAGEGNDGAYDSVQLRNGGWAQPTKS
jgi:hypothetical protein